MTEKTNALKVTLPSDTEIVLTREFNAPRQLVFDAFTKPEHLVNWFGQPPRSAPDSPFAGSMIAVCNVDLRVGGSWRYVLRGPDGTEMGMYGVFHEIDPPARLVNTEIFDDFESMGGESVVTTTFEERDGKTLVIARVRYNSKEARDMVIESGMEEGAGETYDRLEEYLHEVA